MKSILTLCASAAILASAATASAQSPGLALPLPITAQENRGTATNPALGRTAADPGLAYIDANGANKLWNANTKVTTAAPIVGTSCSWGGTVLFCRAADPVGDPDNDIEPADLIRSYDFVAGSSKAKRFEPLGSLSTRGLSDSTGQTAVVEGSSGEVFYLQRGTSLSSWTVVNSGGSSPTVGDGYVYYRSMGPSGWLLNAWRTSTLALESTAEVPGEPVPTEVLDGAVLYGINDAFESRHASTLWDPHAVWLEPGAQHCSSYQDVKVGARHTPGTWGADLVVVRAEGCLNAASGESYLYAFNRIDPSNRAFFVGRLSSTNPDFDVFGDQIAFVDENDELIWVRADLSAMAVLTEETEPNDSISTANSLGASLMGKGAISASNPDFWRFNATGGTTYSIMASSIDLRGYCSAFPTGDTYVEIYDAAGNLLNSEDWGLGYCAAMDFTPLVSGTYFVRVSHSPQYSPPYYIADYYLTIDPL